MLVAHEIAWLAGLLEGEGTFLLAGAQKTMPRVVLAMTDEDVVRHAAALVGNPSVSVRQPEAAHHKPQFLWTLSGASAAALMMTIYVLMGRRRRARIEEILRAWRSAPPRQRPRGLGISSCPHVSRPHYAKGSCHACYEARRVAA